jgi:hypothetical protein
MINSNIFDSAFFGYSDLPELIEIGQFKLIPIKSMKLKYENHSMVYSGNLFSVSNIKRICNFIGIQLYRPVKGLYCVEERYYKFFDYLYQLRLDRVISDYTDPKQVASLFYNFSL